MLGDLVLITYVLTRSAVTSVQQRVSQLPGGRRLAGDAGEGVISTAVAVLIVAFLGVGAYVVFNNLLTQSGNKASTQVDQIGGN